MNTTTLTCTRLNLLMPRKDTSWSRWKGPTSSLKGKEASSSFSQSSLISKRKLEPRLQNATGTYTTHQWHMTLKLQSTVYMQQIRNCWINLAIRTQKRRSWPKHSNTAARHSCFSQTVFKIWLLWTMENSKSKRISFQFVKASMMCWTWSRCN